MIAIYAFRFSGQARKWQKRYFWDIPLPDSKTNSSDTSDELTAIIPISDFKLSGINLADFPVEDFFKVPFSHHITIFSKVKNLQERYYYIHRVVEENSQVAIKPMGGGNNLQVAFWNARKYAEGSARFGWY